MYTTPDDSNLDRCRCGVPARLIAELDLITYMHGTRSRRRTPIWNSTMESPLKFDRAHQTWSTHGNLLVGLLEMGHVVALYLGPGSTRGTHVFFHLSLGLYEWSSITTGKSIHLPEVRLYI